MIASRINTAASRYLVIAFCAGATLIALHRDAFAAPTPQAQQGQAQSSAARRIGVVKAINGNQITLTPDSGADVTVAVQDGARMVRVAPGQKDLKNATPIQLNDIQVGDRLLVGGKLSDDNSLAASTVVVMTHSELAAKHQQELEDWQKRGVDGPATAVDPAAGTVTISSRGKPVVVQVSKTTVIRRYAPDSVKFDDARPSTLPDIHPGDQVRARGERSADGATLTADEIVSGTFRNIAGTVNSVDASASTVNVHDLLSKSTLTIKVSQDSQLHQLPSEFAQRLATRLKRSALGGGGGASVSGDGSSSGQAAPPGGSPNTAGNAPGNGTPRRPGGAPDLQQILNRMPAVTLNDLHKGDAVIILSTAGSADSGGTAITLLTGVEPILQAAPNASGASILTPWSLGEPSDAGGP
jgi:hypothetical protein